jgi:hypothetical protein
MMLGCSLLPVGYASEIGEDGLNVFLATQEQCSPSDKSDPLCYTVAIGTMLHQ